MSTGWVKRVWDAPLAAHACALFAVFVALAAFVGTYASFSVDEGAALAQARSLAEDGSWLVPHPHPEVDPDVSYYPYAPAGHGTKGSAPFAKHPVYSLALAGLWGVGGVNAVVALSVLGSVVAAVMGALLARRVDPVLDRPTLWAIGLGSPLLFDGFLVMAHSLAAAFAGALAVLLFRDQPLPTHVKRVVVGLGVFVLALGLMLTRTEAVFLVAIAGVVGLLRRGERWLGLVALAAGPLAVVVERRWVRNILGQPLTSSAPERHTGGDVSADRIEGALTTLFHPSYTASELANLLLIGAMVGIAASGVAWWRRSALAVPLALVSALAVLARVALLDWDSVPGLFAACPLLWAGVWFGILRPRGRDWRDLLIVVCAFAGGVLATVYSVGGGVEWGGRYFALGIPIAMPVAVAALRGAPREIRIGLAASALALAVLSVGALRSTHQRTDRLLAGIDVPRDTTVVTTAFSMGRLDWARYGERQWLWVLPHLVESVVDDLEDEGVESLAVVYPESYPPVGEGWATRGERIPGTRWRLVILS